MTYEVGQSVWVRNFEAWWPCEVVYPVWTDYSVMVRLCPYLRELTGKTLIEIKHEHLRTDEQQARVALLT